MTNADGSARAFSAGMNVVTVKADFRMSDTSISGNLVHAKAVNAAHGNAKVDSGGATLLGKVVGSTISQNIASAESAGGDATASSGGALMFGRMTESEVSGNGLLASSPNGRATAGAGGLAVDFKPLTLRESTVEDNTVTAEGASGWSRGGGIYNGELFSTGALLKLIHSDVVENHAEGDLPIKARGGGVFSPDRPVHTTGADISGNTPDDCFGC
jgi:hypothetical protein